MAKPTPVQGLHPDLPAQEAAFRWIAARAEDVRHHAGRAARALEEEPVHDLRVAVRRLRAACALFGKRRLRAAGETLKRTQDAAGAVRDLHVLRGLHALAVARPRHARLGVAWDRELAQAQEAAGQVLLAELARLNSRTLPRIHAALERQEVPGRLGGRRQRERLSRLLDVAEARLARAQDLSPKAAHRLRCAVKKLRYGAELLAPALPKPLEELTKRLTRLQDALGRLHDADVLLAQAEAHGATRMHREALGRRRQLAAALGRELAEWARTDRLRLFGRRL